MKCKIRHETKNPVPSTSKLGFENQSNINDISSSAQRQRLLDFLRKRPVTTLQIQRWLNILAPAPRIWELRHKQGYNIVTTLVRDLTAEGRPHRVAKYSLLSSKRSDDKQKGGK